MKTTALHLAVVFTAVFTVLSPAQIPAFTDIAGAAGVNNGDLGRGAAFIDVNNDGFDDIHLINDSQPYEYDHLFLNNGNLTFQDIGREARVINPPFSNSVRIIDVDNDGWLDMMITTSNGPEGNRLYRNNGDNTFRDIFPASGIYSEPYSTSDWGDMDNDGLIDLYLLSLFSTPFDNLWRNAGRGRFILSANTGGDIFFGCDAQLTDLDNDGDLDLFQGVYGFNRLFENNFPRLQEIGVSAGIAGVLLNFSYPLIADYNNDGKFDIFVINFEEYINAANCLYRHNEPMIFSNEITSSGITHSDPAVCGVWSDLDNDGWVDLLTFSYENITRFWHNNGDGTFTDVADEAGFTVSNTSPQGVAAGDINSDGFPDIYLVRYGPENRLFLNEANDNHWLDISLAGTTSNKLGIGTRVKAISGDIVQWRDVGEGNYSTCCNAPRIHFGLGQNQSVDTLYVYWPSGAIDILTSIPADQRLTITEGGGSNGLDAEDEAIMNSAEFSASPNPFNPVTTLTFGLAEGGEVSLVIYDVMGREVVRLADGYKSAGSYQAIFDGTELASGFYFARLRQGGMQVTRKLLLIK